MTCKTCNGYGFVRYAYPSSKPIPCHWFRVGASPCSKCKEVSDGNPN